MEDKTRLAPYEYFVGVDIEGESSAYLWIGSTELVGNDLEKILVMEKMVKEKLLSQFGKTGVSIRTIQCIEEPKAGTEYTWGPKIHPDFYAPFKEYGTDFGPDPGIGRTDRMREYIRRNQHFNPWV